MFDGFYSGFLTDFELSFLSCFILNLPTTIFICSSIFT